MGQNHRGSGGQKSPSGVQGRSPGRGSGDKVPQKLKNFKVVTSRFYIDTICPPCLQVGGGATAPSVPPAPPPMLSTHLYRVSALPC